MEFARASKSPVYLTTYDYHGPGSKLERTSPQRISANRTDVMDQLVGLFRALQRPLPADARFLGGSVKDGSGRYYREMMASKRTLVRDSQGDAHARWVDNQKDDDYFHAEVYCMLAETYRDSNIIRPAW